MSRFFLCSQNNHSKNLRFFQYVFFNFVAAGFFRRNTKSEGAAEGGFKGGIPPRPSVPPERSGGGQFRSKWVRAWFRIEDKIRRSDFERIEKLEKENDEVVK